jgi:uncharacterized protein
VQARVKLVIAGGTGSLGRRVADDFQMRGGDVVILTRSPRAGIEHRQVRWDGRTPGDWAAELEGSVLLNLAGELVDRPPTPANIELLRRSRVEPTRALVSAAALGPGPAVWLQMSTLAIYGDSGEDVIDEQGRPAAGPPQMAGVATAWENAAQDANAGRLVVLRTGIVLDRDTPAFDRLSKLVRLGVGGRLGRGDQWISWVHIGDFLGIVTFLAGASSIRGTVHVTAPNPIRNKDMMAALRAAFGRPWSPPTPRPLVHLGARLMRTDPALALTGRRCIPRRLLDAGYEFRHPVFPGAIADLRGRPAA